MNAIAKAKATIEERAAKRHAQEQKEYEEKATARREKAEASGKKPRGPEPKPPTPGPRKKDQVNLTDEESRIMPSSDKGFVQAYNAQTSVDVDTMLIVEAHISQASNDKQENENADLTRKQPERSGLVRLQGRWLSYVNTSQHNRIIFVFEACKIQNQLP